MRRILQAGLLSLSLPVFCDPKPSSEIFQRSLSSVFTLYFQDPATNTSRASCTGFFISSDGLGITSGPVLKAFEGSQAKIRLPSGEELPAQLIISPNVPGIGFIQVLSSTQKLPISTQPCQEGQNVYIMAMHDTNPYFDKLLITDTNHNWVEFKDEVLFNTPVLRMTGVLPNICFGAPVVDQEGNVVAVIVNVEMGLGIGYKIEHLKEAYKQEGGRMWKAWEKIRESIMKNWFS